MVAILTRIWYTVNAGISRDSYASQNISNQPSSSKSNEQPSSRRTTTSAPPVNLLQFFQSNEDIYAKILRFEPIDIGMVMNALRSDPLVKECSKSTLLTFLDRQGIAYAAQSSD